MFMFAGEKRMWKRTPSTLAGWNTGAPHPLTQRQRMRILKAASPVSTVADKVMCVLQCTEAVALYWWVCCVISQ